MVDSHRSDDSGKAWGRLALKAVRKDLRQHYLDQFFGSSAFRTELSAFVDPQSGTAGWLPI